MDYSVARTTPMMKQWYAIKEQLKNDTPEGMETPIVFCRVGDFYELFYDDAIRASKILDIQLTKRKISDTTYPMAGVPVRSLEGYVARLVNNGHRVAIIDQMEDAKKAKGTITRELTRIVTKGTVTEDTMLTAGKNNYIASIIDIPKRKSIALAVCDLSTGDFRADEFRDNNKLLRAFIKYAPVEILYPETLSVRGRVYGIPIERDEVLTPINPFWFDKSLANDVLRKHFKVKTMKGFGFEDDSPALIAAASILKYMTETQFTKFPHINKLKTFDIESTMTLDATAIKSLELFTNTQDNSSYASLYELMNETVTPMGARALRHWIANPLADREKINERITAVSYLIDDEDMQNTIRSTLNTVGDIERLITRISMGSAKATELIKLANSLESLPELLELLNMRKDSFPEGLIDSIDICEDLVYLIRNAINDEPTGNIGEGKTIRASFNEELGRLLSVINEGLDWIDRYIAQEKQKYGINIKIKQNNVMGYYIDISKREVSKVPDNYIKKQVMVNTSRYITAELKNWEKDVLEAEIKILDLETRIYRNVLEQLSKYAPNLQTTSNAISVIDCLSSYAYLSETRGYNRPEILEDRSFEIIGGRHPVIESIADDQIYVPNDISMDYDNTRLLIITGPNFSGKSSLLRMTALITIMAQTGCFVPAKSLSMGIVDRIFTRIGASDNLVAGQSTFMLEMVDAANLVNNSTSRSLIIADELGRGTSTYDGLAIAWSIAEYLHNSPESPKTMIASHYHQLSELEGLLDACKNYHFSIRFKDGKPVFNHKLVRGSSDKSFGVEVAKLAGLPDDLIKRARQILEILESKAADVNPEGISSKKLVDLVIEADGKVPLSNWFDDEEKIVEIKERDHIIVENMRILDPNKMTPLDALQLLIKFKEML